MAEAIFVFTFYAGIYPLYLAPTDKFIMPRTSYDSVNIDIGNISM